MSRNLGTFVSCAGGLQNAIINGDALGVNTIMIHPSPPQRWNSKPFESDQIDAYLDAKSKAKTVKVQHLHGIYLINLANPDKQKFHLSKLSLVNYLDLAEKIDAKGVVFHTGSFKEIDEEEGFNRVIYGINWILEHAPGKKPLMLEMSAGSGNVIGDKLEELARIREGVEDKSRVKFCLDTQHMFASGYDIVNKLDEVVLEIDKYLGLENILCVHFNDSKTELGSNKDRHENLGEGLIGEIGMKRFLNHQKLKNLDFVMEVPAVKDVEGAKKQVEILHAWAKN